MARRTSLTKDDWLRQAMELLRTDGVGGVRVLTLAKSLGVTRGSFYWHFRDRGELLDLMLDWWDREMTDTVIDHVDTRSASARQRLTALAENVVSNDKNRFDNAIRSWAEGDREVATAHRRVMNKRLEYVVSLFRDAGFSPREARARGHLLAVYVMGEGFIHAGESLETRLRLLRRQIRALTKA